MIHFDFGRNNGCKEAGSKQEVVNKKVVLRWNPLLHDVFTV